MSHLSVLQVAEVLDAGAIGPVGDAATAHQNALLGEIRDARADARQALANFRAAPEGGNARHYRRLAGTIEAYLLTIEPLLLDDRFEAAEYYAKEHKLGEFVTDSGDVIEFPGLFSLIPLKGIKVQEEVDVPGAGGGTKLETVEKPVPPGILRNAFRAANRFIQENGLGIDIETKEQGVDADPF